MKKRHLALLSTVIAFISVTSCSKSNPTTNNSDSATVVTKDSSVNLTKGLLLYLPFNGSIADSSGNNNPTAAINGAVLGTDEHGYANSAFSPSGAGDFIQVTNNGSIKYDTAFSISLTFMYRTVGGLRAVITMINYDEGTGTGFEMGSTVPGMNNFDFGVQDDTYGCGSNSVGDLDYRLNDTTSFIPNQYSWYNAICVYHNGTIETYINGSLVSIKTHLFTKPNLCPDATINVGEWWGAGSNAQYRESFDGKIDNVRLYNRVLTSGEIAELSKGYVLDPARVIPTTHQGI